MDLGDQARGNLSPLALWNSEVNWVRQIDVRILTTEDTESTEVLVRNLLIL